MCDVCKAQGLKSEEVNGPKHRIISRKLYLGGGNETSVTFCYVHDVEYFVMGKNRFLEKYPRFRALINKKIKEAEDDILGDLDLD